MQQVAGKNAPSPSVVIPHFVVGGLAWLVVTVLITMYPEALTDHYFSPKLLAITHLLVLGWITMIIFGALYQLVPVIMETKLFSEKMAGGSLFLLSAGAVLLAVSFWNFWLGSLMHAASTLVLLSVLLFAINIMLTARRATKQSIEKDFILTSIIWLLFTVLVGITLAVNLRLAFLPVSHLELLKLHAHAGIVGWFLQLIIGVGSRLLPMFMVSHHLNKHKLSMAWYFINGGLVVALLALWFQFRPGIISGAVIVVVGLISFFTFITEAYKKRLKKNLDIGMKQTTLSFVLLTLPVVFLVLLLVAPEQLKSFSMPLAIAYGSAILIGFISSLILGQTYKTLPFIIWLKVYRNRIGKGKTPFPKDLYSNKIAVAQLWCFSTGFILLLAGIIAQHVWIIRIGASGLVLSALFYQFNIMKIILHKPKENGQ